MVSVHDGGDLWCFFWTCMHPCRSPNPAGEGPSSSAEAALHKPVPFVEIGPTSKTHVPVMKLVSKAPSTDQGSPPPKTVFTHGPKPPPGPPPMKSNDVGSEETTPMPGLFEPRGEVPSKARPSQTPKRVPPAPPPKPVQLPKPWWPLQPPPPVKAKGRIEIVRSD